MNCPMCGEPWDELVCGACFHTDLPLIPPRWWKRCVRSHHDTSVNERPDGRFEFWCSECHDGTGRLEIIGEGR